MNKRSIWILLFILIACSSGLNSIYNVDYPLTDERAFSRTSNFSVKIPKGWFVVKDNESNTSDLWLVKDDYSASLNFTRITIDNSSLSTFGNSEIEKIASLSQLFIKVKYGKDFSGFEKEESFELNGNRFYAYQFRNKENNFVRVVVFKFKEKFYDFTAIVNQPEMQNDIFSLQNSVLKSIK